MFDWITFLTYAFLTTVTPGPNTILSMSNGSRKGFLRALPLNLGMWCGFTIVMALCACVTSLLSALIPAIKKPMMLLGAAYLLWLAWKCLRRSSRIEEAETRGDFLTGFTMQFVNVKVMLYGVMSYEAYILPVFEGHWPALLGFALVLSTMGFVNGLLWNAFGSLFKVLFSKHGRLINTLMALLLVYCAAKMLLG